MATTGTTNGGRPNGDDNTAVHHCLEVFALPPAASALDADSRRALIETLTHHSAPGGFAPHALAKPANIAWYDEALVVAGLFFVMVPPLLIGPALGVSVYALGATRGFLAWAVSVAALATHPMPSWFFNEETLRKSRFTRALFQYFSYRLVWSGETRDKLREMADGKSRRAWVGAGPPHGVMPFANVLSIPALNAIGDFTFVGAGASIVAHTPFLRYLWRFGVIDVSARSIAKAVESGACVGTVPDGIAGIFRTNEVDEVVVLKHRKGLAKLALKHGIALVPAYSIGNTAAFSALFDKFGWLEALSRRLRASIFLFYGRFGLPIPRKVPITMLVADPILVDKVPNPTQAQIDALHDHLLNEVRDLFNRHKAALGWGHKSIIFV